MGVFTLNQSTLYITPRSPFARRVRMAFLESGIQFEEKVCDVFHPTPELISFNPLARIPILVTLMGQVVADSNLILQLLYESGTHTLMPEQIEKRVPVYRWMGIWAGLCEKTVEYYVNSLLPSAQRDRELEEELRDCAERVLVLAEKALQDQDWIASQKMSQADLDCVAALDYLCLRYPTLDWKSRFHALKGYFERLQDRPAILKTRPPA